MNAEFALGVTRAFVIKEVTYNGAIGMTRQDTFARITVEIRWNDSQNQILKTFLNQNGKTKSCSAPSIGQLKRSRVTSLKPCIPLIWFSFSHSKNPTSYNQIQLYLQTQWDKLISHAKFDYYANYHHCAIKRECYSMNILSNHKFFEYSKKCNLLLCQRYHIRICTIDSRRFIGFWIGLSDFPIC